MKTSFSIKVHFIWSSLLATVSLAFCQNWINPTNFPGENYTVAASADGSKMVILDPYHYGIYSSTNSGASWLSISNGVNLGASAPIASSADGRILIAACGCGNIYISTNSGVSWQSNNVLGGGLVAVTSSADGNKLLAAVFSGLIFTSTNAGATWRSNNVPIKQWTAIASSADGSKLTALTYDGLTYGTTNGGLNWPLRNASSNIHWRTMACAADGSKLAAGDDFGSLYTSTNSGATWMSNNVPRQLSYYSAAWSADGSKLVAGIIGWVQISTNAGVSWSTNNTPPSHNWTSVASSADGNTLVAVGGAVYVSQTVPAPTLNLKRAAGNAVVSWLIPSQPFTLQQNADLTTTKWTDIPNLPSLNYTNLQNEIAVPLPPTNTFYRLKSIP